MTAQPIEALAVGLGDDLAWLAARLAGADGDSRAGAPARGPLGDLAECFRLTAFERELLLLAASPDLDAEITPALAALEPRRPWPHFALAERLFAGADLAALAPTGTLRRYGLVRLLGDGPLATRLLSTDERVVFALRGAQTLDATLSEWLTPLEDDAKSADPRHEALDAELARLLADEDDPLVLIVGGTASERRARLCAAARLLRALPLRLDGALLHQPDLDPWELCRLWRREAMLSPAVLVIEADEIPPRWTAALDRLPSCAVLAAQPPVLPTTRRQALVRVPADDLDSRYARWRRSFPTLAEEAALRLAAEYRHPPEGLHRGGDATEATLAATCRALTQAHLASIAERVEGQASWDDLVLPPDLAPQLRDVAVHAGTRVFVGEAWGFAAQIGRPRGVAALFAGPPGTGKTLAARVIANEIGRDLYRVDLSRVVSKYVGETEKNLARVFDAAEQGGTVLLFDEADALFGKRSEVKDSHDRYANLEVAYLLQRMEAFSGLAILTTNLEQVLDPAFVRRLAFILRFPFPAEKARREIWARAFPPSAPLGAVDLDRLARIPLAGGHIASIAWSAACRAAAAGTAVGEEHILAAARAECAKLERPWQDAWFAARSS